MGFASIIDQCRAVHFLTALLHKGTIPHALLFSGPEGVGKKTTALAFAMAANCEQYGGSGRKSPEKSAESILTSKFPTESCGKCRSCRKIESGNHPDIIRIQAKGQMIRIAQIRDLRYTLSMKSREARLRFVIIGDAHAMNPEAGNALLKVLEEPPDRTVLILTALQKSDLLPTIVSRCVHLRFKPISAKYLALMLKETDEIDTQDAEILSVLANGSFSRALAFKETHLMQWRRWLIDVMENLSETSIGVQLAFAEKLSQDKDLIHNSLELIKLWMRDLIIVKYDPDRVLNKDMVQRIRCASNKFPEEDILSCISAIQRVQKAIDGNANARLALENMILFIAEKVKSSINEKSRHKIQTGRQDL